MGGVFNEVLKNNSPSERYPLIVLNTNFALAKSDPFIKASEVRRFSDSWFKFIDTDQ